MPVSKPFFSAVSRAASEVPAMALLDEGFDSRILRCSAFASG
jgi:hypothetical protein